MQIKRHAVAGTLESSDIQLSIANNDTGENQIELESPVKHLYGDEIERIIRSVLTKYDLRGVTVKAIDKGALNCTIVARLQTVIYRATDEEINWGLK